MEEKEKNQFLGANFYGSVTFNGPMFDIHDNTNVNITHVVASSGENQMNASEVQVKEALLTLLEATDEEGMKVFTEKAQWYAVYKVLSECHGYPSKISEFCDVMKNWGMDKVTPACAYESVRKVPNQLTFPTTKVTLWHNYKNRTDEKFKKQIVVAMKLMKMLEG